MPKTCIDKELTNDFLALGPWPGYTDGNGTTIVSEEDKALGITHWTSLNKHAVHCVIEMKRVYKTIENKGKFIKLFELKYLHTVHCIELLLYLSKKAPLKIFNTLNT